MGGDGVTYTFKFVHNTTTVDAGAAGNIYYIARDGLTDAQRAAVCADAINGVANANAAFSDGNVNSVNTVDLRIIATAPGTGGGATIDLEFANKGVTGNGHENILVGTNGFSGTKILEDAFAGGVGQSEAPRETDLIYKNSLWWQDRAVRSGSTIGTGDRNVDESRDQLLEAIQNHTDGCGPKPEYFNKSRQYIFTAERYNLHGGPNRQGTKNRDLLKQALRLGGQRYYQVTASSMAREDAANHDAVEMEPSKKFKYAFQVDAYDVGRVTVEGPDRSTTDSTYFPLAGGVLDTGHTTGKGDLLAPFSFYSSSVEGAGHFYNDNEPIAVITNIHHDTYGHDSPVPMQGPFTEKYVGGSFHRHKTLFLTGSQDRPEAWNIKLDDQMNADVNKPRKMSILPRTIHEARSQYYRDGVAKRPVNIANIHHVTSSIPADPRPTEAYPDVGSSVEASQAGFTQIGNFNKRYQFVQTSGRKHNSRYFVENDGNIAKTETSSSFVFGVSDYTLPTRDKHEYIFVERFSAPGGPEVMSRGFLDTAAEEYSVYNCLNYRNSTVRQPLQRLLSSPSAKFGLFSGTIATRGHYQLSASFHKTNRNPQRFFKGNNHYHLQDEVGAGTNIITASVRYDNEYVTRPIPQSDLQYKWIRDSLVGISSSMMPRSHIHGGDTPGGFWGTDDNFGGITGSVFTGDEVAGWAHPQRYYAYGIAWHTAGGVSNPAGNLLYKNLGHFGGTGETNAKQLPFGYAQPNHAYAGSPTTDLQFVSASDYVAVQAVGGLSSLMVGGTRKETIFGYVKKGSELMLDSFSGVKQAGCWVDFVGMNTHIVEPVTGNLLGHPDFNRRLDAHGRGVNREFYFDSSHATGWSDDAGSGRYRDERFDEYPDPYHSEAYRGFNRRFIVSSSISRTYGHPGGSLPGNALFLNALLLNRGSVYGWPTWKQIRTGEHPIARYHRKANLIQLVEKYKEVLGSNYVHVRHDTGYIKPPSPGQAGEPTVRVFSEQGRQINSYRIPYLTGKFKPLVHRVRYVTTPAGLAGSKLEVKEYSLKYAYGNIMNFFPRQPQDILIPNSTVDLKMLPDRIKNITTHGHQLYDHITSLVMDPKSTGDAYIKSQGLTLVNFAYEETVWPKEENTYLSGSRSRLNYTEEPGRGVNGFDRTHGIHRTFWRDHPRDRLRTDASVSESITSLYPPHKFDQEVSSPNSSARNSQGFPLYEAREIHKGTDDNGMRHGHQLDPTCLSVWPLDSTINDDAKAGTWLGTHGTGSHVAGELFSTEFTLQQGHVYGRTTDDDAGVLALTKTQHTASLKYTWFQFYGTYGSTIGYGDVTAYTSNIYGNEAGGGTQTVGAPIISTDLPKTPHTYGSGSALYHFRPAYSASTITNNAPWYDSYEEYSSDIRYMAKDYSIIPEFRISEHMDFYLNNNFSPYEVNPKFMILEGAIEATSSATAYRKSNDDVADRNDRFYKLYSHSDFMKFVKIVQEDYEEGEYPRGKQSRFIMRCKGIKKLLPYNGFYPVNRCVQLGNLLSRSFAPNLVDRTDIGSKSTQQSYADTGLSDNFAPIRPSEASLLQTLLQPLMAPGLLFNTIKAGVAVDWPLYTGSYIPWWRNHTHVIGTAAGTGRYGYLTTGAVDNVTQKALWSNIAPVDDQDPVYPNIRLPIEALVQPANYLPTEVKAPDPVAAQSAYDFSNRPPPVARPPWTLMLDMSLGASGREGYRMAWNGKGDHRLYELAINNFLGEIPRFFLEGGKLNSIMSKQGPFQMLSGTTYFMDVSLGKTDNMIMSEGPDLRGHYIPFYNFHLTGGARGIYYGPASQSKKRADASEQIHDMSTDDGRIDAFRYPSRGAFVNMQDPCWAPYTPPYFYGESTTRVRFSPHRHRRIDIDDIEEFSLDEIIRFAQIETRRHPIDYRDPQEKLRISASYELAPYVPDQEVLSRFAKMPLESSINIWNKVRVPEVEYEKNSSSGQFEFNKLKDSTSKNVDLWSIGTKFECPILNFSGSLKNPDGTISAHDHRYPRLMWMQYGRRPLQDEGVYLKLKESFTPTSTSGQFTAQMLESAIDGVGTEKYFSDGTPLTDAEGHPIPERTGSLLKKLGFDEVQGARQPKRKLGTVMQNRLISEAIVAIPVKSNNKDPYYHFPQQLVDWATQGNGSIAIQKLVDAQKKYVFPPHLDFVEHRDVAPIVMYVFEFHHVFSRDDLSNIWQNLMPRVAKKAELVEAVIEHPLGLCGEFFSLEGIPSDTKWMIFKVKQRAESSYFHMLKDSYGVTLADPNVPKPKSQMGGASVWKLIREWTTSLPKFDFEDDRQHYSFNWPYDYFSLVELAKIDARIEYTDPNLERYPPSLPPGIEDGCRFAEEKKKEKSTVTLQQLREEELEQFNYKLIANSAGSKAKLLNFIEEKSGQDYNAKEGYPDMANQQKSVLSDATKDIAPPGGMPLLTRDLIPPGGVPQAPASECEKLGAERGITWPAGGLGTQPTAIDVVTCNQWKIGFG
jgi:hypothetical protein